MKYCQICGAESDNNNSFCTSCGAQFRYPAESAGTGTATTQQHSTTAAKMQYYMQAQKYSAINTRKKAQAKSANKRCIAIILASVVCALTLLYIGVLIFSDGFRSLFPSQKANIYEKAISDRINSEMYLGDDLPLSYQFCNAVVQAIEFEILDTDKANRTMHVRFTYIDVLELAECYDDDSPSQDEYYKFCLNSIVGDDAPTVTETVSLTFTLSESDGDVIIILDDCIEFADVLTGGTASEYLKLLGGA